VKTRLTIVFLAVALVLTNAYWFFGILDQGVTLTYMQSSLEMSQKQYEQSVILSNLDLNGLSAEEAIKRIGKDVYGSEPFVKEGCIWAGQVCLRLENNEVRGLDHDAL
jgi:hypothetical protein